MGRTVGTPRVALEVKKLPAGAGDGRAQVPSLGREDPLQEGMAAPSSTLAWRIPVNTGAWRATVHTVAESDTTDAVQHREKSGRGQRKR